jgi:hypothetical protein
MASDSSAPADSAAFLSANPFCSGQVSRYDRSSTPPIREESPMARTRRETRTHGAARAGFDAAVGLLSGTPRSPRSVGRTCHHCGAEARIDMIDMPRMRAYLTCLSCGNKWDTDRGQVSGREAS